MPGLPPILDTPSSRLIYWDLGTRSDLRALRAEGTAWQVVSAAIGEARDGYPDTTFVKGLWLQDQPCVDTGSFADTINSRAGVVLGALRTLPDCVVADPNHTITLFYRDQKCRRGANQYEEYTMHRPSTFEPKCVVVLLSTESRAALRDELVQAGRPLSYPLNVLVNYTVALHPTNPDLEVTSSNCALGWKLKELYERDLVGQAERDALVAAQQDLATARRQYEVFDRVYEGLSAYRPPNPPPPPLPPYFNNAPPTAPRAVDFAVRRAQLAQRVKDLEAEVTARNDAIQLCVPSATKTCGRSSDEAPNPWIASNGEYCFGNGTYEALEGAFCANWGSEVRRLFVSTRPLPDHSHNHTHTSQLYTGQLASGRLRQGRAVADGAWWTVLLHVRGPRVQQPRSTKLSGDGGAHAALGQV